ncbi:MAG: transaldolase, partial [Anaerolineales bacterium]
AYIAGLEKLAARGGDLGRVISVASLFVSRIDVAVDSELEKIGEQSLLGKIAIANSKACYVLFRQIFAGERWEKLAVLGASVQRPLWASTGTKNPAYPDTLYVDSLIGSDTVNTAPPATLDAFLDHGHVAVTVGTGVDEAYDQLARLAALGIDLEKINQTLLDDGVASFAKAFDSLLASVEGKQQRLLSS